MSLSSSSSFNWFKSLYGFNEIENDINMVRNNMIVDNQNLVSTINGRSFQIGKFQTSSLKELRDHVYQIVPNINTPLKTNIKYNHIVTGDIFQWHSQYPDALFQAASQFNCLEFAAPSMTPEDGIYCYTYDRTQGPACAISCSSGTIFRNYFYNGGQSANNQINTLQDLEELLFDDDNNYWTIKNGYAYSTQEKLERLNKKLGSLTTLQLSELKDSIRIGIHQDVGVMFSDRYTDIANQNIKVSQAYCSALSCAYCAEVKDIDAWQPLASLILESAYEATILFAIINRMVNKTEGRGVVFMTLLGGGVFGNKEEWIARGIGKALAVAEKFGVAITVNICHFSSINDNIVKLVDRYYEEEMST